MDHLRARVGLLVVVRDRDGIELRGGVVALQDRGRILPGDGGTRFHLGPAQVRPVALADAPLGDEVQDAALTLRIAGIPVLDGGVLDIGILLHDDFHHGGMELLLVAHRRGAAFHIAHEGALVGHDERALELAGALRVDAEIAGQVHRAAHPLGDVAEGPVGEHGAVQGREIVVAGRDHRGEILPDQVRMLLHRLGERAEDDALLREGLAEGRRDGDGIEDGVDGDHAGEHVALLEGNAQLLEGLGQFRVDLLRPVLVLLGSGIVDDVLEVDLGQVQMGPAGHLHRLPFPERVQAEFQEPVRLLLEAGDGTDDVFVQALGNEFLFHVRHEAFLVLPGGEFLYDFFAIAHNPRLSGAMNKDSVFFRHGLRPYRPGPPGRWPPWLPR